jgi:uncharacterized membrane-anchored protein
MSFWLVKLLTTGMGETISDFFVKRFVPEFVVAASFVFLVVALVLQFRARKYRPVTYWSTALMVSIFGTMSADVLHVVLGVPYAVSASGFVVLLLAVFVLWWRSEGTLSVHQITSNRREGFYWATVMVTFALGTAVGDLAAATWGLGYTRSVVLFAVVFAVPGLVFAMTHRTPIALFWSAYVLTRPLGASFADWFAVPAYRGGLNYGAGPVSVVLFIVFVIAMTVLAVKQAANHLRSGGTASS